MPSKNKKIRMTGNLFKFGIGSSQIEKLKKIGKTKLLPRGECLLSVGSVPDTVCVLLQGTADILAQDSRGDLFSVRTVGAGEILGLTESIANLPCDTPAYAVTECKVILIAQDNFIEFLKAEPAICIKFASAIATRLLEGIGRAAISESD